MRKNKKSLSDTLFLLAFIGFLIYIGFTLYTQENTLNTLREEEEELISQKEEKEIEIKRLENRLENAASPEFVEKYAREVLNMVKEDETMYVDVNKKHEEMD